MKLRRLLCIVGLAEIAALVVLHFFLIHWLAEKNVVATILAAGRHVPRATLALAGLFYLVRLLLVLCLPGIVLSRVGMWAFDRWRHTRDAESDGVRPSDASAEA